MRKSSAERLRSNHLSPELLTRCTVFDSNFLPSIPSPLTHCLLNAPLIILPPTPSPPSTSLTPLDLLQPHFRRVIVCITFTLSRILLHQSLTYLSQRNNKHFHISRYNISSTPTMKKKMLLVKCLTIKAQLVKCKRMTFTKLHIRDPARFVGQYRSQRKNRPRQLR